MSLKDIQLVTVKGKAIYDKENRLNRFLSESDELVPISKANSCKSEHFYLQKVGRDDDPMQVGESIHKRMDAYAIDNANSKGKTIIIQLDPAYACEDPY